MGNIKVDDELHQIIKDKLNQLEFKIEYKDAKGFADKAIYKLLVELGFIKNSKKISKY